MAATTSQLRSTVFAIAVPAVLAAAVIGTWVADRLITQALERQAGDRLLSLTRRADGTITRYLAEQQRLLRILAEAPAVVAAARVAGDEVERTGLARLPMETLETRYAETRALQRDPAISRYLASFLEGSDLVDLSIIESHGLVVTATSVGADFVQADEAWWSDAMDTGTHVGSPEFDEAAGAVSLELAVRVTDPASGGRLGVVRGLMQLSRLTRLVTEIGADEGVILEVVDSAGRALLAADSTRLLRPSPFAGAVARGTGSPVARRGIGNLGEMLLASTPARHGRGWVVAAQPVEAALALVRTMRRITFVAAGIILGSILAGIWGFGAWLRRGVTQPVQAVALAAARVAQGDLSSEVDTTRMGVSAELRTLVTSMGEMVRQLRELVTGIRSSAEELAAMAQQISASTEEMSASTQEMASTSQRLSDQATEQARQTKAAAADAERILAIATQLAEGAQLAAGRSSELRTTAEGHRGRLVAGSERLAKLAMEVEESARDAETLAALSAEIQQFVTQAKTIATRTNMLALNAAIEAARAGTEGQGFAVVAEEVRKLASQAAQAAQSTSDTVSRVLAGVQTTRDRLRQLAGESAAVRTVADEAARGLEDITGRAVENSAWADEIAGAAAEAKQLVEEITVGLRAISDATEGAGAAIEEIAASAQEQSASTEEVASSAAHLAEASEHLNAGVSRFRLSERAPAQAGD